MQNKQEIDSILNSRNFEKSNLEDLNSRIIKLAQETHQAEFQASTIRVNNSVKIIAIMACFVFGIFTGFNFQAETLSNDLVDYMYTEEGIV